MALASFYRPGWHWWLMLAGLITAGRTLVRAEEAAPVAGEPIQLVLAGAPGFRQAGYYQAQWQGVFAQAGLSVQFRYARRGEDVVDTVLVEPGVYVVGGDAFFQARLREHPVVLLAAIQQETPQALTFGSPGRPEAGPADLAGGRIGLAEPMASLPLRLMLRRMSAGPDQANWLTWDPDGVVAPEQFTAYQTTAYTARRGDLRPADQGVVLFYGDCLFASEAELAYHPARVAKLRAAVLRGWELALQDVEGTVVEIEAHADELNLRRTAAELKGEAEVTRGLIKPTTTPLGTVDLARVAEIGRTLVELDFATAAQVENLRDFVYQPPSLGVPQWVYGIGLGLVAVTLIALGVSWFNVRLQRRVHEGTARLRESQERYREMFEHAPVAIVEEDYADVVEWIRERRTAGVADLAAWLDEHPGEVTNQFNKVTAVRANHAALEMVGVDDLASYARCLAPDGNASLRAAFREEILALWRGELDVQVEMSFTRADGSRGDGLLQWTVPMVGGRPDFGRVLVVVTQVTELRAAEQRVRESEARFRTLFESAIEGVYESTPDDGLVAANPAFARMLGCATPDGVIAWCREVGVGNLYVETGRRHAFLKALSESEAVFDFESEIECADGSRKWISENVRALRSEDGRLLRLQGFVSDISERRRFEQVLGEERERLAVTLRAMTEGVITTDHRGIVQFVNEAAETLTGWAEGAAIGRRLGEVCVMRHERTRVDVPMPFDAAMRSATVVDLPRSTVLVHRMGGPKLIEGRCAPIHDARSRPVGVVVVLRDVTERARHESEMLRTTKLESLGVLAGGIAHDFNNLLTVVLGNLHLARRRTEASPDVSQWLRDAELAAEKAQGLTQQLLTFAKGGNPVRAAVRLAEVVKEAAAFALHGSSVRCEMSFADSLWTADVDRSQIGQVVQNLVLNAVQAMPVGGVVTLRLQNEQHRGDPVRSIVAGSYLLLEIEDTGQGIPAEHLGRIFDPYFTTKETGSGLGLATVYSIIKRHSGHVEVSSEPGEGTRFRILLPALPTKVTVVAEETKAPTALQGRVLFMDDEANIRRMAEALLQHLGLEVETVRDGETVLQRYFEAKAGGTPFDVVVMDLTVPGGMGGREAMEKLRGMDPGVRAVVSSGYSIDPVLANFTDHGFRARVTKPYRAADLARVLREVLEGRTCEA